MKATNSRVVLNFILTGIAAAAAIATTSGIASAASPIGVSCALPYLHGHDSTGCVGQHTVMFSTSNTDANAKVTAEVVGLDVNGNPIHSFVVHNGDTVQLGSRLSPIDWKFITNPNMFQVFAPVPLLHVVVEDQGQRAEAFCSDIPYVQVLQPNGGVVTESSGDHTNVLAAVPLTDPASLQLIVDGVNILSQVPNFLACTPHSPCNGTVTINGNAISYTNLMIDIAPSIDVPASNTVQVTLTSLACGGHIFRVSTQKEHGLPDKVNAQCDVDPLSKAGTASVFAINITNPITNQITTSPTPVMGNVCSGTQITDVNINGKDLPLSGETHTTGNGTTTGDLYNVPINTTLDKTDLLTSAFGTHQVPLGTFDPGTNRLTASAREIKGNRTFKNVIFATGNTAAVSFGPNPIFEHSVLQAEVNSQLEKLVKARIEEATNPTATDLQNAFVLGLSAGGAQTMFNSLCTSPIPGIGKTPGQIFQQEVTQAIQGLPLPGQGSTPTIGVDTICGGTVPVTVSLKSVSVSSTVTCNLTFHDHFFHVTMGLPDVTVVIDALGSREDDLPTGGCFDGAAIGAEGTASISGITLDFDVTENDLKNNTATSTNPIFFKGNSSFSTKDITNPFGDQGASFCGLSKACAFIIDVFTFGAINLNDIHLDLSYVHDFSGQIGASQPDPVKLHQISVNPTVIQNFNQTASGDISEVHISSGGITAGLVGHFSSLAVDPSIPANPGITLTPAPVPTLPVPNLKDIFIGISDDAINMFFASLTAAGRLQTGSPTGNSCIDTGVTVGSVLPASCDTLIINDSMGNESDLETAAARGYCHAIKGDNCATLTFNDPAASASDNANLQAAERGECYGAQGLPAGETCATLTFESAGGGNLLFGAACLATPNFNLHASQPLLFCARGDVPPRMLFPDNPGTGTSVPAVLRIPSLSVELIIDRDGDHQINVPFQSVPACLDPKTSTAVDCNLFAACFALNLDFTMGFQTCSDGKPGFVSSFTDIQVLTSQIGTVCGGATATTADTNVLQQGSSNPITIPLGSNGAQFAPPICGAGLDLGGFVQCTSPGIASVRSENTFTESRDYLAITCKIQ